MQSLFCQVNILSVILAAGCRAFFEEEETGLKKAVFQKLI